MIRSLVLFLIFTFWLALSPAGAFAQTATLSLDPPAGTFNRGCSFSLNVNLDAGGTQTDGADAILIYDPSRFNATSVTNGTVYPDYPGNNIDAQNGRVTISGLASVTTPFSGKGLLATINFTVQSNAPAGSAQMKFDFDPTNKAKTTDSNVVQRETLVDVLNSVTDGNYTIGTGACGTQGTTSPAPTTQPRGGLEATPIATKTPTLDEIVDRTGQGPGSPQLTFTLAIFGGILTVLGILGLALL